MSRRSLRPQLNQIRGWVRQGRTDAWIAHQLEVTVQQIQSFKREQGLEPGGEDSNGEEIDLRAEADAEAAATAAGEAGDERSETGEPEEKPKRARTRARGSRSRRRAAGRPF